MIHPLTIEQEEILNGYLNSGMTVSGYAKSIGLEEYHVRYIVNKYNRLNNDETSSTSDNEIVKLDLNIEKKVEAKPISIKIGLSEIIIENDVDKSLLIKAIEACVYATRFE